MCKAKSTEQKAQDDYAAALRTAYDLNNQGFKTRVYRDDDDTLVLFIEHEPDTDRDTPTNDDGGTKP